MMLDINGRWYEASKMSEFLSQLRSHAMAMAAADVHLVLSIAERENGKVGPLWHRRAYQ